MSQNNRRAPLEIHVREISNTVVCVEMIGRLGLDARDGRLAEEVKHKLLEGKRDFLISCASVDFINSIGIGVLLKAYARVIKLGGRFKLCDTNQRVCNIFNIAFGDSLFEYTDTCENALKDLLNPEAELQNRDIEPVEAV